MVRAVFSALLGLGLLVGAAGAADKSQTVKVKKVDDKTNTLVVTTADGKSLTFEIDKKVKIVGPRGGVSEDRLKDDRLAVGSEITISLDGKTLKEIKLGFRKKEPDKEKPVKDKPFKDKPEKDK